MIDIYIYENLINGKVYIGQTNNLKRRNWEHNSCKSKSMPIDLAINKYGRQNFSLNIITSVETEDQANYTEIEWIIRAKELLGKNNVYNLTNGGEGYKGGHSEESKKRLSKLNLGENNKMFGKTHSLDTKQIMSEKAKQRPRKIGQETSMFGKQHSQETKNKISNACRQDKHWTFGKPRSEETKAKISKTKQIKKFRQLSSKWFSKLTAKT